MDWMEKFYILHFQQKMNSITEFCNTLLLNICSLKKHSQMISDV